MNGSKVLPDGTKQKGLFIENKLNGSGIIKYPDGLIELGEFQANILIKGTKTYPGWIEEKGTFSKSKLHGIGSRKSSKGVIEKVSLLMVD